MAEDVRLSEQTETSGGGTLTDTANSTEDSSLGNLSLRLTSLRLSNSSDKADVTLTQDKYTELSTKELNDEVYKLNVELNIMHDENENMKLEHKKESTNISKSCEEMKERLRMKCDIIKSMEAAQLTLQELICDKDALIESQNVIIESLQTNTKNDTGSADLRLEDANVTIAQINTELDVCKKELALLKKNDNKNKNGEDKVNELTCLIKEERQRNSELLRKIGDQVKLCRSIELAFDTQGKQIGAKNDIITNLKSIISQKQTTSCSCTTYRDNMTSNSVSSKENDGGCTVVPGMEECILCLKNISLHGCIMNGFLTWADIQRNTSPKDHWKTQALQYFTKEEVSDAKQLLWEVCDESVIGNPVKRQGGSKQKLEIDDICKAMENMSEKQILPIFVGTSTMISRVSRNTSNVLNDEEIESRNGVEDCCNFLKTRATNGVSLNGLLLWADIQRKVTPENIWKAQAVTKFDSEEITEAKDLLWRTAGDSIIGRIVKRQGVNKSFSEINDICSALKLLSEKDSLPMFICTGNMISQTPIYTPSLTENGSSEVISTQLKTIQESIDYLLASPCEKSNKGTLSTQSTQNGENILSIEAPLKETSVWSIPTITTNEAVACVDPTVGEANTDNKWTTIGKNNNGRKSWRQKANILHGTSKSETEMLSADIHLVVYGLAKQVTALQLSRLVEQKGIKILACDLLTKYEGARSLSFKISVRSYDYEKVINPDIWPVGVGIRHFKFFARKDRDGNNNDSQSDKPKSILKKQGKVTTQDNQYHGNQIDMQKQHGNRYGMQNNMHGYPGTPNIWRPQFESEPRQVRFTGAQSGDFF